MVNFDFVRELLIPMLPEKCDTYRYLWDIVRASFYVAIQLLISLFKNKSTASKILFLA